MVLFRKHLKNKKGFTLIELLIVVLIIGVLAAIAIPKMSSATDTAARGKIQADLRTIDSAVATYQASGATVAPTVALVTPYLAAWPTTPKWGSITAATGYTLDTAANSYRAIVTGYTWHADTVPTTAP